MSVDSATLFSELICCDVLGHMIWGLLSEGPGALLFSIQYDIESDLLLLSAASFTMKSV